jgi:hypothetical protein
VDDGRDDRDGEAVCVREGNAEVDALALLDDDAVAVPVEFAIVAETDPVSERIDETETAALREAETVGASVRDDDADSVCEIEELEREVDFAL